MPHVLPILRRVYELLAHWPQLNRYTGISLALGFTGLLFNLDRIRKTVNEGERRQQDALDELRRRILDRVNETRLLTPNSVRSLAHAIENKMKCAIITDKLISEAIRAVALDLEDHFNRAALVRRLESLNDLVKELDASAPPLLSLAVVDRLTAYRKSEPMVVAFLFLGVCVTSLQWPSRAALVPCLTFLVLEFLFILSTVRAQMFWRNHSIDSVTERSRSTSLLCPSNPHPIFDFFLNAMISREPWTGKFWHKIWGPIWEAPLFSFGVFCSPSKLIQMHEFRYDLANRLLLELRSVQRQIDIDRMKGLPTKEQDSRHFALLCRRLWVVTGQQRFREMERTGELSTNGLAVGRSF